MRLRYFAVHLVAPKVVVVSHLHQFALVNEALNVLHDGQKLCIWRRTYSVNAYSMFDTAETH